MSTYSACKVWAGSRDGCQPPRMTGFSGYRFLAARAISESVFEAVYDGVRTADLQGHAMTTEFTDEVIRRVKTKLAV